MAWVDCPAYDRKAWAGGKPMTLKAVDSASPLEGGVNQHGSVEDLLHALLAPFVQKEERGNFPWEGELCITI
jgi:hypothetical protein